jgi:hypothetical protein
MIYKENSIVVIAMIFLLHQNIITKIFLIDALLNTTILGSFEFYQGRWVKC